MRNHVQPGRTLTLPAPYDVLSGGVAVIGAIIGVANGDAVTGAPVDLDVEGVFTLPKTSALAIAIGEKVYYSPTSGLISKTTTGDNVLAGVAVTAAANPSASVNVRFNGAFV